MKKRFVRYIVILSILFLIFFPAAHAEEASEWYMMGENAVVVGDYASAITYYDNAIALDQRNAAAFSGKSYAFNQLGNFAAALDAADQAVAIKDDPRAFRERAYALFKLKRYDESVQAYDTFFTFQTNLAETYCNQGMAYDELNQMEKAIGAYERCAALDPRNVHAWNRKGLALMSLGRYEEALTAYNQCTRITIDNAEVWNNKGIAYWAVGDYNNALVSFKRALNIDPAFSDAKQNLEKIYAQEPFVTPGITSLTKASAPARTPSVPPAMEPATGQIPSSVTTYPAAEIATGLPSASQKTYAPLSPFIIIIGLAISYAILLSDKYRN